MTGPQPVSPKGSSGSSSRAREQHVASAAGLYVSAEHSSIPQDAAGSAEVQRFIRVLLSQDEAACQAYAQELISRGQTTEQLYEGLFADAARTLGVMWETDDCTFYDVTVGTGRIQRLIREFSHQFLAEQRYPGTTGRILLGCAADEQHSLGLAMLAEFFVRDGWDVHIGPGLGTEGLLDKVRETEYNLLGLSVSVSSRISKLQQDIRRARQVSRNRDIRVIVGGVLITADSSLAERIGADGYALDARSAVSEARRLLFA